MSSEETVKIRNQCPCWWVNGRRRTCSERLHEWGLTLQPGTVLPDWHLPLTDLPSPGMFCCLQRPPARPVWQWVSEGLETGPPVVPRLLPGTRMRPSDLIHVNRQSSKVHSVSSWTQSKFNEGSFLILQSNQGKT